jgi:hypothetical protein
VINNNTYLGKIDLYTNKSSIVVNNDSFEVLDVVSLIYEMNGKAFFASYKSALNGQKESSYLINQGKIIKQDSNKILFYR